VRLTDDQIADLCARVGFPDVTASLAPDCPVDETELERAIRIVLGESGGNPAAINDNGISATTGKHKGFDRGLFQINSVAWPSLSPELAFQPEANARFAQAIWKKQGGFKAGASAWWGGAHFHSMIKKDGVYVRDSNRLVRARKAVLRWRARMGKPIAAATSADTHWNTADWLVAGTSAAAFVIGAVKYGKKIKQMWEE